MGDACGSVCGMRADVPLNARLIYAALPASGPVFVWMADAIALSRGSCFESYLPSLEIARLTTRRADADRAAALGARVFLRKMLSALVGHHDPRTLDIIRKCWWCGDSEHGKPKLERADFDFNLSHSGGQVALAVAYGTSVGVDLESLSSRPPPARYYLDPLERSSLGADATNGLLAWTAKEATLKGLGVGLGVDLRAVHLSKTSTRLQARVVDGRREIDSVWLVVPVKLSGFALAVARPATAHGATCEEPVTDSSLIQVRTEASCDNG
jgi:4'-phosphopantetheinyl transferase